MQLIVYLAMVKKVNFMLGSFYLNKKGRDKK